MSEVEKLVAEWKNAGPMDVMWRNSAAVRLQAAIAADKQAQPSGEVEVLREALQKIAAEPWTGVRPIQIAARAALTAALAHPPQDDLPRGDFGMEVGATQHGPQDGRKGEEG